MTPLSLGGDALIWTAHAYQTSSSWPSHHPELKAKAEQLMPESAETLINAARELQPGDATAQLRGTVLAKAARLLDNSQPTKQEQHYLRGSIFALQGNTPDAIEQLSLAVELDPLQSKWRYELAMLLKSSGDLEKAQSHIAECWRLDPNNKQYETTLKELIHLQLRKKQ